MIVLFAAPNCLLDPSSGSAQSCRAILEGLVGRGHEVAALGATVFDRTRAASGRAFVEALGARRSGPDGPKAVWKFRRRGVHCFLMVPQAQRRLEMTAREEDIFFSALRSAVDGLKPDVVLTYGGQILDRFIRGWLATECPSSSTWPIPATVMPTISTTPRR